VWAEVSKYFFIPALYFLPSYTGIVGGVVQKNVDKPVCDFSPILMSLKV
jgi:hypothetical protein